MKKPILGQGDRWHIRMKSSYGKKLIFRLAILKLRREFDRIFRPLVIKINNFLTDTKGMFHNIWIASFTGIKKPGIFYGYFNYKYATKYANKRYKEWPSDWDQLGRQQGILPFDDLRLLVCSPKEMKDYQKRGLLSTEKNYKKYFKHNYYQTKKRLHYE
jgi:hypothetical protein